MYITWKKKEGRILMAYQLIGCQWKSLLLENQDHLIFHQYPNLLFAIASKHLPGCHKLANENQRNNESNNTGTNLPE